MEVGGEGGAYLSGADPINHSALHRFTRTSAVHFPYSEHPSGGSSPVAQAPAVLDRLSVGGHVCCRSFVLSSESSLSCLSVANVPFFPLVDQALAVSPIWHVLMLTELLSSDNVTIS